MVNQSPASPTNENGELPTEKIDDKTIDIYIVDQGHDMEMKPSSKTNGNLPNGNDDVIKNSDKSEDSIIKQNGKVADRDKKISCPSDVPDEIGMKASKDYDASYVQFSEENSQKNNSAEKTDFRKVGFFELFRFSGKLDKLMMFLGTLGAVGAGCTIPVNFIIYGNVAFAFIQNANSNISNVDGMNNSQPDLSDLFDNVTNYSLQFLGVGFGLWLAMYVGISMFTMAADSQMTKIRNLFFRSILRQEIGWFDTHDSGELGSRMADDLYKIHDAIGDKTAMFIQWITIFFAGFAMALIQGWKLALAVMSISPILIFVSAFVGKVMRFYSQREMNAYAKAGAVAEEVLSSIRTVAAFHGQEKEVDRYSVNLHTARRLAIRKSIIFGVGTGSFWVVIFIGFAIAFIYGMILNQSQEIHPGVILQVFFGVLMGAISLGHAVPNLENFALARAAASVIYDIIDRDSEIDSLCESGEKPVTCEGNLVLKDVHFNYPSRPDTKVLQGFSVEVCVGQTVALVGSSGCGKSTIGQLLQRFYDPQEGAVMVDGRDVCGLNIGWLRRQIGVVSQEPVLFATTIAENIRYGKLNATQQEIEAAAREANAHDFIMDLPLKYETEVGERGAQLSGGQKQRIAIARALVSNPKILVLDEATSALDTESESIVQDALEKAQHGRTTLVIAHRLSTIINADKIVAMKDGQVIEQGTHAELMQQEGFYHSLYEASSKSSAPKPDDDSSSTDEEADEEHSKLLSPKLSRGESHRSGGSRLSLRRNISGFSQYKDIEDEQDKEVKPGDFSRIIRLNSPEWLFILVGCVAAVIVGGIHPMFAIVFSELLKVFTHPDPVEQLNMTYFLAGMIICVGVGLCLFKTIQNSCFGKSGANLTMRMRNMAFKAMLRQDMAWFDKRDNQVGSLTTVLANDCALVEGATGVKIGIMLESMASILVALVIAFVYGWKLAFVVLAFFPVMIFSGIVQGKMLIGFAKGDRSSQIEASRIALEAIDNIRTVASLTLEGNVLQRYSGIFKLVYKKSLKKGQLYGLTYGFTQSVMYFAYAAAFSFGAFLVQQGEMEFFNVFRVFAAIIFTGMSIGRTNSFAPDFTKAKLAAGKLFSLFDHVPDIDTESDKGEILNNFSGKLTLKDVKFRYPTRPDVRVLRGLDLEVNPGETVALVGASGCGKSTVVQLVERFYDPLQGDVLYDDVDGQSLNVNYLRSEVGIVSQEPVLFDRSIKENIAYGDNNRDVSMAEIIEASRAANIHSFIENLPLGYETPAGDKGGQLSGGQKQRVAIARALIRNPKILLLDEATSALDSESERIVQEALDSARKGRTCLVIAHRLSTIQTADRIAVIHQGRVAEIGSHKQLLARKSHYYNLNNTHILAQRRKSRAIELDIPV